MKNLEGFKNLVTFEIDAQVKYNPFYLYMESYVLKFSN
jgi:hypothetical protein